MVLFLPAGMVVCMIVIHHPAIVVILLIIGAVPTIDTRGSWLFIFQIVPLIVFVNGLLVDVVVSGRQKTSNACQWGDTTFAAIIFAV